MPRSPHPLKVVIAPLKPDGINYYLRAWAEAPLQKYRVGSHPNDDGTKVYKLEELLPDGTVRLIGSWRGVEAPWLRPFLSNVLPRLHGAWHIAQEHLKVIEGTKKTKSHLAKRAHKKRDKMIKDGKSNSEIAIALQRAGHKIGVTPESVRQRRKILANLVTSLDTRRK